MTGTNRRLAQWRVKWLIEHATSHQLLWCIDSFVLNCGASRKQIPISNSNEPKEGGSFTTAVSPNGTFDQNGNAWEYNEAQADGKVGLRGGSWYINDNESYLHSSTRYDVFSAKWPHYGFRVVALGGAAAAAK